MSKLRWVQNGEIWNAWSGERCVGWVVSRHDGSGFYWRLGDLQIRHRDGNRSSPDAARRALQGRWDRWCRECGL